MERTIITIGREYGSGGREVAEKLSAKLGIALYDKEKLIERAKEKGTFESMKSFYNEKPIDSLLYAIAMDTVDTITGRINRVPFEMMKEIAEQEDCIIVGRCGNYIFKDHPDALRVFIHADAGKRTVKIGDQLKLSSDKAADLVKQMDRERASFYRFHTEEEWEDLKNYDLSLDSGIFGVDGCVEMICEALKRR